MKLYFLFATFLLTFTANSQIVVDRSDMPVQGSIFQFGYTYSSVSPGTPGLNQIWDLSTVSPERVDNIYYIPAEQGLNYQLYPQANMARYTIPGTYEYCYEYYEDSGTDIGKAGRDLYNLGSYDVEFLIHDCYPVSAWSYLPYNYGDTHTYEYTVITYSGAYMNGFRWDSIKYISHYFNQLTVDGSGTLITPDSSYEALRVTELVTRLDSSFQYIENTWTFQAIYDTSTYSQYSWYGKNHGLLAEIKNNDLYYFINESAVNVKDPQLFDEISISPNPVKEELFINSRKRIMKVEILDKTGYLISTVDNPNFVSVNSLNPGLYFLKLTSNEGYTVKKFIKQ